MEMILLIFAGISQGVANTIRKISATTEHRATTITTTTMLVNALLCAPLMFVEFRLPTHPFTWVLIGASVLFFALSAALFFKSYQHLELSTATILYRTSVVFIAIIGVVFLKETMSPLGIIGVFVVFLGAAIVSYGNNGIALNKTALYPLLAALMGSIAAVLDKRILSDISPFTYAFINNFLVGCVFLGRRGTIKEASHFIRRYPYAIISSSALGIAGFVTLLVVLSHSQVSQTMPFYKTISFFIPVLFGITLYKERTHLWRKLTGFTLAVAGIILLYV